MSRGVQHPVLLVLTGEGMEPSYQSVDTRTPEPYPAEQKSQ